MMNWINKILGRNRRTIPAAPIHELNEPIRDSTIALVNALSHVDDWSITEVKNEYQGTLDFVHKYTDVILRVIRLYGPYNDRWNFNPKMFNASEAKEVGAALDIFEKIILDRRESNLLNDIELEIDKFNKLHDYYRPKEES